MSVTRVHKTKDYTVMSNYHFKDKELSLKAKGLLSLMLSLPENWDYSIEGLATLSNDGRTAVKTALQELEKNNYLHRQRVYENGKIADMEYHIFESPKDCKTYKEKLNVENLHEEKLYVENNDNKILKKSNTKKINTNNKLFDTKEKSKPKGIQEVVDLYNEICVSLPKVIKPTEKRRKGIQALIKKGYTINDFREAFELAEQSDFLTGKNDRGWKANFDFFLREDKFVKILEGDYGGRKSNITDREGMSKAVERYTQEEKQQIRKGLKDGKYERI